MSVGKELEMSIMLYNKPVARNERMKLSRSAISFSRSVADTAIDSMTTVQSNAFRRGMNKRSFQEIKSGTEPRQFQLALSDVLDEMECQLPELRLARGKWAARAGIINVLRHLKKASNKSDSKKEYKISPGDQPKITTHGKKVKSTGGTDAGKYHDSDLVGTSATRRNPGKTMQDPTRQHTHREETEEEDVEMSLGEGQREDRLPSYNTLMNNTDFGHEQQGSSEDEIKHDRDYEDENELETDEEEESYDHNAAELTGEKDPSQDTRDVDNELLPVLKTYKTHKNADRSSNITLCGKRSSLLEAKNVSKPAEEEESSQDISDDDIESAPVEKMTPNANKNAPKADH